MREILVSGVKPTGRPHIGNYLGAMRQFVDLHEKYDSRIFIADLHALNTIHDRDQLHTSSLDIALDYLAIGLDPKKMILYKQSDVPEVTELSWVFNTLTTVPYLQRAHAYKDAVEKNREVDVGTFCYPLLMAADILIHDADVVPVGSDQKQHIEISRDIAEKFNNTYGETFKLPKELTQEETKTIPGTDGQKMSKSYNNTIPLFAADEEITKAVMSIATDSKSPEEPKDTQDDTLYTLHILITTGADLDKIKEGYLKGGMSYKESKEILIKHIIELVSPLREKRFELAKDVDILKNVLEDGAKRAHEYTDEKMEIVRKKIGVSL